MKMSKKNNMKGGGKTYKKKSVLGFLEITLERRVSC